MKMLLANTLSSAWIENSPMLSQISDLQDCELIDRCCFKVPGLLQFSNLLHSSRKQIHLQTSDFQNGVPQVA